MKPLGFEQDAELLMEFRQLNFEAWVKFCAERGYEPEVSE